MKRSYLCKAALFLALALTVSLGAVTVHANNDAAQELALHYATCQDFAAHAMEYYTDYYSDYLYRKATESDRFPMEEYFADYGRTIQYEMWMTRSNDDPIDDPPYFYAKMVGFDLDAYGFTVVNRWHEWDRFLQQDGQWVLLGQIRPAPRENIVQVGTFTIEVPELHIPRSEVDEAVQARLLEALEDMLARQYPGQTGTAYMDTGAGCAIVLLKKDPEVRCTENDRYWAIGVELESDPTLPVEQWDVKEVDYYGVGYKEVHLAALASAIARCNVVLPVGHDTVGW